MTYLPSGWGGSNSWHITCLVTVLMLDTCREGPGAGKGHNTLYVYVYHINKLFFNPKMYLGEGCP